MKSRQDDDSEGCRVNTQSERLVSLKATRQWPSRLCLHRYMLLAFMLYNEPQTATDTSEDERVAADLGDQDLSDRRHAEVRTIRVSSMVLVKSSQ